MSGVWRMMSVIGCRSSWAIAMYIRGMTRKVERHVAFVAVAEIGPRVLGPLVGLGEQHPAREMLVHLGADALQDGVGLGQVLVDGAVALDQVRDGVEAQPVDPHVQPEVQHPQDLAQDASGCRS